ncbi:MAG: hypothetical protein JNG84_01520, partial [Archangium sp.]|nr:hypothetical protein [Archangium sp.]
QQAFFEKHGPLRKRDFVVGSARQQQFEAIERKNDRAVLDLLWDLRDVSAVLVSGAQGTEFEGVMWSLVDRELRRVVQSCEAMRAWGVCRPDVPSEVVGSMLIGSWLLMLRQMTELTEKPDLAAWLEGLSRVLAGGIGPQISPRAEATPRRRVSPKNHQKNHRVRTRSAS